MTVAPSLRWRCIRAGKHLMTTWIGDAQCTYVALRVDRTWQLTRHVAGADGTVVWDATATLRAAKTLAADDVAAGVL